MDKVFSARLDHEVIDELERAARKGGITKKRFLEEAILERARKLNEGESDIWSESFGAWRRKESATATVKEARSTFRKSQERYKR